ncbi:MAG: TIGR01777 family protein [Ignavibacteriales bacterium]|nr:MAG: TIGR01777 family protein [Ignavibacteriales bacterium]
MKKRILITGATGLIGTHLCKELSARGDILTAFTRDPEKARIKLPFVNEFVQWNYKKPEEWKNHLNKKNAVIHLAGANLFAKRWTEDYKKKIIDSREITTQNIAESFSEVEIKPKVFICASATGYYGDSGERDLVESLPPGNSFTAEVCKRWEAAAIEVEKFGVRRVSLRTATVFNKGKGAIKNMALPFKFFVGGTLGNGQQWFPWIHIKDLVRIYLFAIDNEKVNGSVNAASPHQIRMKELTDEIGRVLHRPSIFKVPGFALKIALGEFADELLVSLKVVPKKLEENNFNFLFGDLRSALTDLIR